MTKKLGAEDWQKVLNRLAEKLPPTSQRHVTLIGGVAMALAHHSRRTTDDADVIMQPDVAEEVLLAAAAIAEEFQLPAGWLNQKAQAAELVLVPNEQGRVVLSTPSVVFDVPSTEHLLGMKLARFAGETDIQDAEALLRELLPRFSDPEDAWTYVGGFVPVAKRDQARHNLDVLWEKIHEPA